MAKEQTGKKGVQSPRSWLKTKWLLVPGGVVLVTAVAGLIFFWQHYTGSYAAFDKQVTKLTTANDYDGAAKKLQGFIKKSLSNEQKAKAWVQLGTVYINQLQYDKALQAFQEAEKLHGSPTSTLYSAIGLAAQKKGDKATALDAYKKALALAKQEDHSKNPSNRDIQYFSFQIRALGGTP